MEHFGTYSADSADTSSKDREGYNATQCLRKRLRRRLFFFSCSSSVHTPFGPSPSLITRCPPCRCTRRDDVFVFSDGPYVIRRTGAKLCRTDVQPFTPYHNILYSARSHQHISPIVSFALITGARARLQRASALKSLTNNDDNNDHNISRVRPIVCRRALTF